MKKQISDAFPRNLESTELLRTLMLSTSTIARLRGLIRSWGWIEPHD